MPTNAYIIKPSEFNRRITVRQFIPVTDDAGGTSNQSTQDLFATYAKIENMGTFEKVQYGIDAFTSGYKLTMRFTNDRILSTAMQIVYNDGGVNRPLAIMGTTLITEGYKRYQMVVCKSWDENS